MEICVANETKHLLVHIMGLFFDAGWETFEPVKYYECGHYFTTLYFPKKNPCSSVSIRG